MRDLAPDKTFSLAGYGGFTDDKAAIREMRADKSGVWYMLQSRAKGHFALVRSDNEGGVTTTIPVGPDVRPSGIATTSRGVAAVLFTARQGTLVEYTADGKQVMSARVGCFLAEGLLRTHGRPATICPDGKVTTYSENGQAAAESLSWARPGSLVEVLSGGRLAIIDQATAQILLNDPVTGTITAVHYSVPEIQEALQRTDANKKAATLAAKPGDPPLGRQLIVMDTASDEEGFYVLVWPYLPAMGPAVVKFSNEGRTLARYRCRGGNGSPGFHKIEVTAGYLFLGSVDGNVVRYKL